MQMLCHWLAVIIYRLCNVCDRNIWVISKHPSFHFCSISLTSLTSQIITMRKIMFLLFPAKGKCGRGHHNASFLWLNISVASLKSSSFPGRKPHDHAAVRHLCINLKGRNILKVRDFAFQMFQAFILSEAGRMKGLQKCPKQKQLLL